MLQIELKLSSDIQLSIYSKAGISPNSMLGDVLEFESCKHFLN